MSNGGLGWRGMDMGHTLVGKLTFIVLVPILIHTIVKGVVSTVFILFANTFIRHPTPATLQTPILVSCDSLIFGQSLLLFVMP